MGGNIKLTQISRNKEYQVSGFANSSSDYAEKLYKMGFVKGTPLSLAPVRLSDPLVIPIRGSRIALRKNEAQQILVQEF